MAAALAVVKVAEDVAVTECAEATLVECEAELLTGAAMAIREMMMSDEDSFGRRNSENLTSANSEGGENELEEVLHLGRDKKVV